MLRICHSFTVTAALCAAVLQLNVGAATAAPPADMRCEQQGDSAVTDAIGAVKKLLDSMWLVIGDNMYTSFRKAGERANPFDFQAKQGPSTTLEGYIWVAGLTCKVLVADPNNRVRIRFHARAVSFRENGEGWTKPIVNPLLTEIEVTRSSSGWTASEDRGEYSVLLPDEKLVAPKADDVPKPDKHLGIPCQANHRWTGRMCAKQK